ncbi:MAG TPA: hypothetical protein VFW86_05225 [Candidatus Limnocylindrales bacterium]|nr:hypothetical protein [Candidatus Limnocylindrales bacterium]
MTQARSGPLVLASALIGLGVVLLVQRAAELPWSEGWPLFVILVGAVAFVSTVVHGRFELGGAWAFTWPVAWIVVGVLLLLSTTGRLGQGPGELIATYWPWALIALGIWFVVGAFVPSGRGLTETLALPLDGATEGHVSIRFGAGTLMTHVAAADRLVDGSFTGGVLHRLRGPGRLELDQDTRYGLPWLDRRSDWDVGLTDAVPLDLTVAAGASKAVLDFRELRVRSLELQTGASDTRVLLPRAAGSTTVRAQAGAASLTIEVPTGVAARIRTRMALGSAQIDQTRFPPTAGGYESPDYATSSNRVDIDVGGGVGSVRIVGVA